MLTPTGVTYAQYWNAIKAGNPTHVRLTFLGQNIVLDDSDIYLNSGVTVTDMFNGDTDLVFGRTLSKQVTVTFINSSKLDPLQWTGEFTLEFGVEIGNPATTNWVTVGLFSGEKPNNVTSARTIQFTAYDRMGRFNLLADDFVKSLSYPKTVKQIYDAVCSYVGMQNVTGNELANIMSRSFASAPAEMIGYTCRDILAWIAEASGCYAKINSAGKVKMVWFTDNTSHAVTGTEEFSVESGDVNDGFTWDEADTYTWNQFDNFTWDDVCGYQEAYRIDKLYVKQLGSDVDINYPTTYGESVYTIVDNPFLSVSTANDITNYIAPIYNRLYSFGGYLPVQLACVGNWCVEAGDIITIDVNSFTITSPIFVKEMKWNSAINDTYETTGSKTRQVYNSSANKQVALSSNKIELYVTEAENDMKNYTDGEVAGALNTVDQNYYKIRSGITIDTNGVTISGSKYIKMQSGTSIDVESGGKIDIKNGADLDVESGGDVNIKSGGKVDIASGGSIDVESGGNINVKSGADVNVKSGGNIKVESGGNFKIASGGNMDVNATGTLALTGSTVSITSGSTFDVSATNFSISSANKQMVCGNNYFNNNGFTYIDSNNRKVFFGAGSSFPASCMSGILGNLDNGSSRGRTYLFASPYDTGSATWIVVDCEKISTRYCSSMYLDKKNSYYAYLGNPSHFFSHIYVAELIAGKSTTTENNTTYNGAYFDIILDSTADYAHGNYGAASISFSYYENDTSNIYISGGAKNLKFRSKVSIMDRTTLQVTDVTTLYYNTLIQNSSKDIKHDIKPLQPIGEKLDALKPVTFVYDDDKNEQQRMGLIYEDTVETMPEICTGDESDKAINYVELIPALLKEIQELRIRVKTLEEREVN